jgi:hypothetical protein
MTKRWRELREAIDRIARQLDLLDRRAEKMEVILMVREPSSGAAAEAYEGLRKQVVTAVTERLAHLSQLVQLDAALSAGSSTESVAKLVRGWLEQASLAQVGDPNHPDRHMLFEMLEDLGGDVQVLEPAYVDTVTGRVIRRGSARRAKQDEGPGGPPGEQSSAPWEVEQ